MDFQKYELRGYQDFDTHTALDALLYREASFRGENCLVGMVKTQAFDVYLDTSGKESNVDDVAVAVSLCLSTPPLWDRFKREWIDFLRITPIPPDERGRLVFHTTDFWNKKHSPYRNEDGWSGRDDFYRCLIHIIKRNTLYRGGFAILLEDYRRVLETFPKSKFILGQAGTFAMLECFRQCTVWAQEQNVRPEFSFVNDRDDEFWGQIKSSFDSIASDPRALDIFGYQVDGLIEGCQAVYTPLQAADLTAWEFAKAIKQHVGAQPGQAVRVKPSLNSLNEGGSKFIIYSYEELQTELPDLFLRKTRTVEEIASLTTEEYFQLQGYVDMLLRKSEEEINAL